MIKIMSNHHLPLKMVQQMGHLPDKATKLVTHTQIQEEVWGCFFSEILTAHGINQKTGRVETKSQRRVFINGPVHAASWELHI